jgi:NAD+ synthase (glutamine-hydrolysing)
MKIAMAQINSHLGDFKKNADKIIEKISEAAHADCDLIVFPELSLLGYNPNDLLERPESINLQNKELSRVAKKTPDHICVLLGCLNKTDNKLYNSGVLIKNKKVSQFFNKELLPNYDVFDESRHFRSGDLHKNQFKLKGKNFLVTVCEDLWFEESQRYSINPLQKLKKKVDYAISLNASPFSKKKQKKRERIISTISKKLGCPVYYVNTCGAQDELIFDGQSFVSNAEGKVVTRLPAFKEHLYLGEKIKSKIPNVMESLESSLILGIRDYFKKTGFEKAHLGLSGGIDSALVAHLTAKALGSKNVTAIALPGPYSSKLSLDLAKKLSKNLNLEFIEHDFNGVYSSFMKDFETTFGQISFGLTHENVQARLRALNLMAFSNKNNSLLMATSNKSELCVGYSTLYGDQCGALMPIGDLLKTEVFELCQWINESNKKEIIPKKIISRPPSAELRPNQKDSDSLPSYEELDQSVERMITERKKPKTKLDHWVLQKSYRSEFKRWQSAPILRVSEHAFGVGRRMPLAHQMTSQN